ncbi:precorrin-2 dehydrogenase/sirohydrochlorin ferrochelatase family protein [Flammeovirga kamogawensis]|uniref:precorrin-2 dehydrogenase n=1 Tax=Flammeovirga kamogawensis TaxID=373891 RepID=A0ABX8H080_9BACT|nr:bifunctional precorrin-2 dehydrogenase/sirohydrochlorin ferrochelatase [Flammeovirga kamogawensis]MBB6459012.1 siroheme synthase-like protein [Flammeovirga kamogawensis]QWG08585.1 bifunctional precorrin-2 dehydrogenase/sirohydrochlorin ferrochelatase [Flammeovirga kamogawensis]TRX66877.1 bifunctional precorrin-2 dehydrogenase/sirohydrochlorin ferrochelatase [Flammeovirga kamogawensis]
MNEMFPIFIKMSEISTLIVGGGNVGHEKLAAILKNSPNAVVTVVSTTFGEELLDLAKDFSAVTLVERPFEMSDLESHHIVLCATDSYELHVEIQKECNKRKMLVNVADTPPLCDFYLGSVVSKGDLKIGISTNGKSPTLAKRMREFLEDALPSETQQLLDNLKGIRDSLKGDFADKVKQLNDITQQVFDKKE